MVSRRNMLSVVALIVLAAGVVAWMTVRANERANRRARPALRTRADQVRDYLYAQVQPIALSNCELKRFGERHDGGYVMCANLLGAVQSGYSYGISGYDQWGCDVSRTLSVPVHQYDCFDLHRPVCRGGKTIFHPECIAGKPATIDGRPFDTFENQFAKNGDGAARLVVKIDVEGAEWDSFLETPSIVLDRIDQLVVEFHGNREGRFIATVVELKELFYVANLHFNNFACEPGLDPFPTSVYEVLLVNKKIGVPASPGMPAPRHGLDAPNNPNWKDCQAASPQPGRQ